MLPHAREENLAIQQVADELVAYDTAKHIVHRLNPTTALVWRHCDGRTTVTELAALLALKLGIPASEQVAYMALDQLDRAHLLRAPLVRSADARQLSRRQVLALVLGGAMVLLVPGCDSITAPRPELARGQCHGGREKCGRDFCSRVGTASQCEESGPGSDACRCKGTCPGGSNCVEDFRGSDGCACVG